jgi:hypothetical protein
MPATPITLIASSAQSAGDWKRSSNGGPPSFTASVKGTGPVSATVLIEVRNTPEGIPALLGTITLSGTGEAADGFGYPAPFYEYRARITAISGTGAVATAAQAS